jgi:hypothetical protein
MHFFTKVVVLLATLLSISAAPPREPKHQNNAPTVSVTELNDKNTKQEKNIDRGKRSAIVPIIETVGDDIYPGPQIPNEVDLLTEDDWMFVAEIVQELQRERAIQRQRQIEAYNNALLQQQLEIEEAKETLPIIVDVDPEISDEPIIVLQDDTNVLMSQEPQYVIANQPQSVPVLIDDETNTMIVPENEIEAQILLSSQQPQNDDPLVDVLTDEIEKEQELREHIDELALLLKTRYAL